MAALEAHPATAVAADTIRRRVAAAAADAPTEAAVAVTIAAAEVVDALAVVAGIPVVVAAIPVAEDIAEVTAKKLGDA
ncbi:MAG TPA: hypothetical protein VGV35_01465 [Bryobacteraceae bacterium]|nr:hypothetical protein [Bryobacteraceae bacterium]